MYPNIRLEITNDYDAMSLKAAEIYSQAIKEYPQGSFGFATGSTPIGMYRELVRLHKDEGLDFSNLTTFNLDEYHPILQKSEHSYYYFMQQHLFSHVNIDPHKVFVPSGEAKNPMREASAYEDKIQSSGGIIMQILGMGLNGHIGFNEPGEAFEAATRLVPLAEITMTANARNFPNPDDIPRHAITMGIRSIMLAKHILLMVSGAAKASILRDALCGSITPLVPASILQLHPSVTVVVDKEAAALL